MLPVMGCEFRITRMPDDMMQLAMDPNGVESLCRNFFQDGIGITFFSGDGFIMQVIGELDIEPESAVCTAPDLQHDEALTFLTGIR